MQRARGEYAHGAADGSHRTPPLRAPRLARVGKAKDADAAAKKLPLPTSVKELELEKMRLQLSSLRWAHLEEEGALWTLRKFPERYPLF